MIKTFLMHLSIDLFGPCQKTTKSIKGGIIMANVELATAPTKEMNKSILGTLIANKNVNNTRAHRNKFSITLIHLNLGSLRFVLFSFNGLVSVEIARPSFIPFSFKFNS